MGRVFLTCRECKETFLVRVGVWECPDCGGKLEYDIYSLKYDIYSRNRQKLDRFYEVCYAYNNKPTTPLLASALLVGILIRIV